MTTHMYIIFIIVKELYLLVPCMTLKVMHGRRFADDLTINVVIKKSWV